MTTDPRPRHDAASETTTARDPERVAAQAGVVLRTDIVEEPLEPLLAPARALTMTRAMGALVVFDGVVRDHDGGRGVLGLSYTAHPEAARYLAEVAERIIARHPAVRLWAVHRVGPIPIGESALTVLAAAAHRGAAFAAAQDLADAVKAEVPIWKEQHLAGGGTEWVGL
ncbi:molybdopterin converting factor [Rothia kristinae]|uniref:Molybdopterin converting factor n=1 Tax=Rothia kristinae TaxID=37923 RepID=A0A1S2N086_9MICC|nr:molybdenum cofactor biosynthesis protein MoaE [Rothia kristinae]OIJ35394.1 molybdopterin converting factor [Rothia kristinae]